MDKLIICFDFDGVIHEYKNPWTTHTEIKDGPVPGTRDAINVLKEYFKIVIYSARSKDAWGIEAMKEWLARYDIYYDEIVEHKPPAIAYVDDRAVRFEGVWTPIVKYLLNVEGMKPWNRR